ncbi:hypothetical protein SAMN05444266_10593 [Chitinophaga jiangningensis]|uniref:Uncharacterized protein n=2 Tax=Chitinophaga jiangningensis TaxID=1419482 RepID=A0A1M7DQI3_9BACT|nr:hypothetical protein SAMN05444266_10593 [Chitinophaga jiangningensis]
MDPHKFPVTANALQGAMLDSIMKKQPTIPWKDSGMLSAAFQSNFHRFVSQNYGNEEWTKLKGANSLMRDSSALKKYVDTRLRGLYSLREGMDAGIYFKQGAVANKFGGAQAGVIVNNAPGSVMPVQFTAAVNDQVTLMNIPFDLNYTQLAGQPWDYSRAFGRGLKHINFNKDVYMERLSKSVGKSFDVDKYFLKDLDVGKAVKGYLQNQLDNIRSAVTQISGDSSLRNLISPEELVYLDSAQIKQVVANGNTSLPDSITGRYLDKLYSLKAQIAKDKAIQRLLSSQHKLNNIITADVNSPENQKEAIKSLLPLNFVQRLFLEMRGLQLGNVTGEGRGLTKDLFMSGLQSSLLSNNKFAMVGIGTRNDARDIKNIGLSSNLDGSNYAMQFLQLGTGDINGAHTHVGALNANTKQQPNSFNMPVLPKNIFVGAVSEQIDFGAYGTLAAELEKSNTSYKNVANDNSGLLASKAAAAGMFNDFMETVSIGLDYNGEVKSLSMNQRVYAKFSGMAYSNPGSPSTTRGAIKYGLKIDKQFQKNRVAIGFRMDRQDTRIAAMGDSRWKNSQYAVDFRMRVKKNLTLTSRIGQSMMKGATDSTNTTAYVNRNLSISSLVSGRLLAIPTSTNMLLSLQQVNVMPVKSVLVNVNLNHNFILVSHLLSFNVLYNKDLRNEALYGNLITVETAYSYQLVKLLNCSSGITYLDNKSVVQQAGLRQTVSAGLTKRLQANLYVDCRKNLLNTAQNYLFGTFTTSLVLQYQLK